MGLKFVRHQLWLNVSPTIRSCGNMSTILSDVKKVLGVGPDYDAFDTDILMHINGASMTLEQLGVKRRSGPVLVDTEWSYYLNGDALTAIQSYLPLAVRLAFDPPSMSFQISAIKDQLTEMQWRIAEQVSQNRSNP